MSVDVVPSSFLSETILYLCGSVASIYAVTQIFRSSGRKKILWGMACGVGILAIVDIVRIGYINMLIYNLSSLISGDWRIPFCSGVGAGLVLYAVWLQVWVRHSTLRIWNRSKIEGAMDILAGHRREKIIGRFVDYCRSCKQMMERAEKAVKKMTRRKEEACEMFTVQTPEALRGKIEEDLTAYYEYIATTNRILLQEGWSYNRFVYLPLSDEGFAEAFGRSYEFVRVLLYEFFFGFEQDRRDVSPANKDNIDEIVSPLPLGYPYGAARSAYRERQSSGSNPALEAITLVYTAQGEGVFDVLSNLDLHIPPGSEISIAFSSEASDGGNTSERGGVAKRRVIAKQFLGSIRVCEPDQSSLPEVLKWVFTVMKGKRREAGEPLRAKLGALLRKEWLVMNRDGIRVNCGEIARDLGMIERGALAPFFCREGGTRDVVAKAKAWRRLGVDGEVFAMLWKAASTAVKQAEGRKYSLLEKAREGLEKSAEEARQKIEKMKTEGDPELIRKEAEAMANLVIGASDSISQGDGGLNLDRLCGMARENVEGRIRVGHMEAPDRDMPEE